MVLEDIVIETIQKREVAGEDLFEMLEQQFVTHEEMIPFSLFMEALQLIRKSAMKYCSDCKRYEIPTPTDKGSMMTEKNLFETFESVETMPAQFRQRFVTDWENSSSEITRIYTKYKQEKAERARLPRCRLCNAVHYCCAAHERKDWNEHKKVCAAVHEIKAKMRQFLSCQCVLTLPSGRTAVICEDNPKADNQTTTEMEFQAALPEVTHVKFWKSWSNNIIGKNQIAVPATTVTIKLSNLPKNEGWFKYTIVEKKGRAPYKVVGFTKEDVVALIGMTYELIYMKDDATSREINRTLNGFWGHDIGHLVVERIRIGDIFVKVQIGT